jgi:hypothetical protein
MKFVLHDPRDQGKGKEVTTTDEGVDIGKI